MELWWIWLCYITSLLQVWYSSLWRIFFFFMVSFAVQASWVLMQFNVSIYHHLLFWALHSLLDLMYLNFLFFCEYGNFYILTFCFAHLMPQIKNSWPMACLMFNVPISPGKVRQPNEPARPGVNAEWGPFPWAQLSQCHAFHRQTRDERVTTHFLSLPRENALLSFTQRQEQKWEVDLWRIQKLTWVPSTPCWFWAPSHQ